MARTEDRCGAVLSCPRRPRGESEGCVHVAKGRGGCDCDEGKGHCACVEGGCVVMHLAAATG